jgi:hypothetical protein
MNPRKVIVFDRTCVRGRGALSPLWAMGAKLYRGLGRTDVAYGASSWSEALDWLNGRQEPIEELQFWGHGKWGRALVGRDTLDVDSLRSGHTLRKRLDGLKERVTPRALIWFRTCETLGTTRGIDFAERLADFLGARVAGHTFIIGFYQSGLRGLSAGTRADWSPDEGLASGTPREPRRARLSQPMAPRTITCLHGRVPDGWLAGD